MSVTNSLFQWVGGQDGAEVLVTNSLFLWVGRSGRCGGVSQLLKFVCVCLVTVPVGARCMGITAATY